MASVLQILGLVAVMTGVFMFSVPVGVIVGGVLITVIGVMMEPSKVRGKDDA